MHLRRILMAAILMATATLFAAEVEDRITKSVPVQPGGRLTLSAEFGSIEVIPSDARTVQIDVERKVDAPSREESERILKDFDLQISESGNQVTARGIFKTGWRPSSDVSRGSRRHCRDGKCLEYAEYLRTHRFKVLVPREFNVDLTTHGGSVSVGDLRGEARGSTSGGSLHFGRITGPIWGQTSGGSVTLAGSSGKADVKTSGGSIRIGEVSGDVNASTSGGSIHIEKTTGKVFAHTSGGSVEVREALGAIDASTSGGSVTAHLLAKPTAPCQLSTSGGSINVHLAENVGVELDASTSGGRVSTEFPVTVRGTLSKHSLKTSLNGGGPLLHLRTSGGNIHVRRAGNTRGI